MTKSLSLKEKITRLFIVPFLEEKLIDKDLTFSFLQKNSFGGVIFMQNQSKEQKKNSLELKKFFPSLLITQDAEWGAGMRVRDLTSFPKNFCLGAIKDLELIYKTGYAVGVELKNLGVDINFAPVVDLNTNFKNPIISFRSFGKNPDLVTSKAKAWLTGLLEAGVIGCLKHFPGHGESFQDSHLCTPKINLKETVLKERELIPFKRLASFCPMIMSSHLFFPEIDPENIVTFSPYFIETIARKELGFEGVMITDSLTMNGATDQFCIEQAAIKALFSGHDLLLFADHRKEIVLNLFEKIFPKIVDEISSLIEKNSSLEILLDKKLENINKLRQKVRSIHSSNKKNINKKNFIRTLYKKSICHFPNNQFLKVKQPWDKWGYLFIGKNPEHQFTLLSQQILNYCLYHTESFLTEKKDFFDTYHYWILHLNEIDKKLLLEVKVSLKETLDVMHKKKIQTLVWITDYGLIPHLEEINSPILIGFENNNTTLNFLKNFVTSSKASLPGEFPG